MQLDTVPVLLSYLARQVSPSIYIQDQAATVLANMAARQDTRCSTGYCLRSEGHLALTTRVEHFQQNNCVKCGKIRTAANNIKMGI